MIWDRFWKGSCLSVGIWNCPWFWRKNPIYFFQQGCSLHVALCVASSFGGNFNQTKIANSFIELQHFLKVSTLFISILRISDVIKVSHNNPLSNFRGSWKFWNQTSNKVLWSCWQGPYTLERNQESPLCLEVKWMGMEKLFEWISCPEKTLSFHATRRPPEAPTDGRN